MSKVNYEEFYHFFQPLYSLASDRIFGYESLLRSKHFSNPETFFEKAKKENKRHELDMQSIKKSIEFYFQFELKDSPLFINIFPATLLHPSFQPFIENLILSTKVIPNLVVFEIIEEDVDLISLIAVVSSLRKLGFGVASDDVGKGAASLEAIIELQPQFVKMDRYFSINLSKSVLKQRMIETLLNYCKNNSILILEGIEYPEDLSIAKALGVTIGQGYLLGRPDYLENVLPDRLAMSTVGGKLNGK